MIDIEPADVSIAGPAEVICLDIMVADRADRCGACNKTVLVVMTAVVVEVGEETQLTGVPFPDQILAKNIRDINLLLASAELVEIGIGILLQHVERGDVVLPPIIVVVAENSDAKVGVVKNEPAEVAHERLNSAP